jgi:hypothetical protein
MNSRSRPWWLALACGLLICLGGCDSKKTDTGAIAIDADQAATSDNLPQADPVFAGKIGTTYHDSKADKTMFNILWLVGIMPVSSVNQQVDG